MALLLGYPSASAQEKPCTKTTEFDRSTNSIRVIDCKRKVLSQSTLNPPSKSSTIETSSAVDPFYTKVQESFAQYAIWQNNYTQRIFEHQIVYTVIIFVVVNLLVLAGLYFAWLQFRATLRLHQLIERSHPQAFVKQKHAAKPGHEIPPAELDNPFPVNELRFGPDGIAISSSIYWLDHPKALSDGFLFPVPHLCLPDQDGRR